MGEEYLREQLQQEEDHEFSEEYNRKKENLIALAEGKKGRKWSRSAVACACGALVLGASLTVYAAVSIYHASVDLDKDSGVANIHLEKTDSTYVPPIKIYADYLPEGYAQWEENKYSLNGEYGGTGISIVSANGMSEMDVMGASEVEETTINGVKATIITRKGSEYSHFIYLFYEETGNVIEIMASEEVPEDEVIKVAENIRYEVIEGDDTYQTFQTPAEEDQDVIDEMLTFDAKDVFSTGDTLPYVTIRDLNDEGTPVSESLTYSVTDVQIQDKVPLNTLDAQYFSDPENVLEYIGDDGTLKPYQRTETVWEDGETKTKDLGTVNMKYLAVTLKMTNTTDQKIEDVGMYPRVYPAQKESEEQFKLTDQDMYGIQPDQTAFYFDQSDHLKDRKEFYFMNFEPGETKEIHLGFAVAEDKVQDSCLVFQEDSGFSKYLFLK